MSKDWVTDGLMPLRLAERSQSGYKSKGCTTRRFTAADRKLTPGARAYVALDHHKRTFEIVTDADALGGCPIGRVMFGLHESGHILNGDVGPGLNARKLGAGDRKVQEREAWRFVTEAAPKYLGAEHLESCLDCVGTKPEPSECTADLPGLLENLAGPNASEASAGLAGAMLKAVKAAPGFFETAAAGLTDSKGRPLIGKPKRKSESRKFRGELLHESMSVNGPIARAIPEPMLVWVRVSDGRPLLPELGPRLRLWHADA